MFGRLSKYLNYDWVAVFTVVFLAAFGLVSIYILSLSNDAGDAQNFEKQLFFLAAGTVLFISLSQLDYRVWKSYSAAIYLLGVVLLVLVLFFGKEIRGTSGWFSLGFFNFQPAELMKFFLIISLANYFSRQAAARVNLQNVLVSFCYVFIPMVLVAWQPDMGSAMVILAIWLAMLFLAGLEKKYVFVLTALVIIVPVLSYGAVLKDYQKERIRTFLDPGKDPLGSGYNVIQSMVAVGSGGVWGKGLGHGSQSRLNFLPEKHTDFIFATIAEESGLVGSMILLGLFILLFFRLKSVAQHSRDGFGRLLVGGVMAVIIFQVFINIGMNVGIMPIAGLSLPFISYGGSFLIVMMSAFGLTQSVWKRRKKETSLLIDEY